MTHGPSSEPYDPANVLDRLSRRPTLEVHYAHMMERERRLVRERTLPYFAESLQIVAARFGIEAGMIGAAALAYEGLAQMEEMVG